MSVCPTCTDYLSELRRARDEADDAHYHSVMSGYMTHLQIVHNDEFGRSRCAATASTRPVSKDQARAIFGRMGE